MHLMEPREQLVSRRANGKRTCAETSTTATLQTSSHNLVRNIAVPAIGGSGGFSVLCGSVGSTKLNDAGHGQGAWSQAKHM